MKKGIYFTVAFLLFIFTIIISISVGAVNIPLQEIMKIFSGKGNETSRMIILNLRLPRIVASAVVGMGLSVVGVFFKDF